MSPAKVEARFGQMRAEEAGLMAGAYRRAGALDAGLERLAMLGRQLSA
jgi:hypothetical protein